MNVAAHVINFLFIQHNKVTLSTTNSLQQISSNEYTPYTFISSLLSLFCILYSMLELELVGASAALWLPLYSVECTDSFAF